MKQSLRSNENFFAANTESSFDGQSCDLPPPPPHILALSNQYDLSIKSETPYIMPPPPCTIGVDIKGNQNLANDSVVPPPMPIINPPPRQSSVLTQSKSKSPSKTDQPNFASATSSQLNSTQNSLVAHFANNNPVAISNVICNKISHSINIPPRLSSITSVTKAPVSPNDKRDFNISPIFKVKPLPSLQLLTTTSSIVTPNPNINNRVGSLINNINKDINYCAVCGHSHEQSLNHLYIYQDRVDAELLCKICQKPYVDPLETKCGHTFCTACLKSHLAVQAFCPEDKQIINYLECSQASSIVKRLLDKLLIICPNTDGCGEVMPRAELEAHLLYWCRTLSSQPTNSNNVTSFQAPKHSVTPLKWDSDSDKPGATVTQNSVNSGSSIDTPSSPSVNNNLGEDNLIISSSSSDSTTNKGGQRVAGANSSNHHKNSVRFDLVHQTGMKYEENDAFEESLLNLIIDRSSNTDMGISFVGGSDTPLPCIIVQDIYLDGAIAKDNRMRPGDQIVSVNDIDLNQVTHMQAKIAFHQAQQQPGAYRLLVYRERTDESLFTEKEDILQFCLSKRTDKKLGIKLVGQKNKPGLYVLDLVKGSEADLDGRLRKNDRILSINGVDLKMATQDVAANVINDAEHEVRMAVSRIIRPQTPDLIRITSSDHMNQNLGSVSPSLGAAKNPNFVSSSFEKIVIIEKNYGESLGMSVAGGVNSHRGNIPIYVTNLVLDGIVTKTQKVNKGDILMAVNETELLGLSHEKAVDALKSAGQKCRKVSIRLLQGPESTKVDGPNFSPSWVYWLQLPRFCEIPHCIILKRDSISVSLGFSIVGGADCGPQPSITKYGHVGYGRTIHHQPIVVKSIVTGSVAHRNGRLKCGDILLKVNSISLINLSHNEAVSLFKNLQDEVILHVVSWPGTIV